MKTIIKNIFIKTFLKLIPDRLYYYFAYYYLHLRKRQIPKILNLKNPNTFNEKIICEKIKNRFPGANLLVDKYEVRAFIKETIGPEYLIPLLGVYENVNEINFSKLPSQFVLKANQGSGWNILVKNKRKMNEKAVKKKLSAWLRKDYYQIGREWQYKGIKNKIIAEKLLVTSPQEQLMDYKFFCFRGKPELIQVDIDRFSNHSRNFYDLEWNLKPFGLLYPRSSKKIYPPDNLAEMIYLVKKIANRLKENMDFVRIDMYYHNGQIYFGEITFHAEGGCAPFFPQEYDQKLGNYFEKKHQQRS